MSTTEEVAAEGTLQEEVQVDTNKETEENTKGDSSKEVPDIEASGESKKATIDEVSDEHPGVEGHSGDRQDFVLVEDAEGGIPEEGNPEGLEEQDTYENPASDDGEAHQDDSMHEGDGTELEEEMECEGEDESLKQKGVGDLQSMVNQVLEHKMEGFQAQMQAMLSMIQSVSGLSTGGEAINDESKKGTVKGHEAGSADPSSQKTDTGKNQPEPLPKYIGSPEHEQFKKFLETVHKVLDMPTVPKLASVLDDTIDAAENTSLNVESLPVEGMVKNSWQKVEDKYIAKFHEFQNYAKPRYPWAQEETFLHAETPALNPEMAHHLKQNQKGRPKKSNVSSYNRMAADSAEMDFIFRYQQRILSYASYFLAALSKGIKDENAVSKETMLEILKYLSQCLIDTCDAAVRGCQGATMARRRIYLDAMNISSTAGHFKMVFLPVGKTLFPTNLNETFMGHGINLNPPTVGGPQASGAVGRVSGNAQSKTGGPPDQGKGNRGKGASPRTARAQNASRGQRAGRGQNASRGQSANRGQNSNRGQAMKEQLKGRNQGSNQSKGQAPGRSPARGRDGPSPRSEPRTPGSGNRANRPAKRRRPREGRRRSSSDRQGNRDRNQTQSRRDSGSESKRSRLPSDSRMDSRPLVDVGRFPSRSGGMLYDYDTLLGPSSMAPPLFPSTAYPIPSLGGGYRRVSDPPLGGYSSLGVGPDYGRDGFQQGSDDDDLAGF